MRDAQGDRLGQNPVDVGESLGVRGASFQYALDAGLAKKGQ
ncbi:hypothetical protein ACIBH1_48740 [Nonomuraea sp. NPDC050663]